jgi:chaperonin GroES
MFKPFREHVLIELEDPNDKTFGGLIIPENAREKQRKAKVIAVGPGWFSEKKGTYTPLIVKPGDRILVGSNIKGTDVELNKKKYELIRENFIFALIDKDSK